MPTAVLKTLCLTPITRLFSHHPIVPSHSKPSWPTPHTSPPRPSPPQPCPPYASSSGVLTSDPRIVSNTRPVNTLTFEEATELAYYGAQVCAKASSSSVAWVARCFVKYSYQVQPPLCPLVGPASSGNATGDSLRKDERQSKEQLQSVRDHFRILSLVASFYFNP